MLQLNFSPIRIFLNHLVINFEIIRVLYLRRFLQSFHLQSNTFSIERASIKFMVLASTKITYVGNIFIIIKHSQRQPPWFFLVSFNGLLKSTSKQTRANNFRISSELGFNLTWLTNRLKKVEVHIHSILEANKEDEPSRQGEGLLHLVKFYFHLWSAPQQTNVVPPALYYNPLHC